MTLFSKQIEGHRQPSNRQFVLKTLLGGLSNSNSGSTSSNVDNGGITTTSQQLFATQNLYENSSRLGTCGILMDGLDERLIELEKKLPADLAIELKKERSLLRNIITPMIHTSEDSTKAAAKLLKPLPAVKRYNDQQEVKRRREVADSKEPEQQLVKNFLRKQEDMRKSPSAPAVVSPSSGKKPQMRRSNRKKKVRDPPVSFEERLKSLIPLPLHGTKYCLGETIKNITDLQKDERANTATGRSASITKIFEAMVEAGYIDSSRRRTVERHVKAVKDGKQVPSDMPFDGRGRKPIMTADEVNALVEEDWKPNHGHGFQSGDIEKALLEANKKKKLAQGILPKEGNVNPTTIDNYRVQLANHPSVSISQKTIVKSTNRDVSEKSIRMVLSLLTAIGAGHFIPVDDECPEIKRQLRNVDAKCRLLYDLVQDALGVSVYPVKPEYIYSTDDTTCYIFEGKVNGQDKWTLVTNESIRNSGTNAVYRVDDSKIMNGMRVKLTFTFSAAGMCAPLFVTVSGLSKEEMPNQPFLHMKVPGLCIGGGGVTLGNKEEGHVFFMRKEEGADKKRCELYMKEVLIPFVNGVRKEVDDFDAEAGASAPATQTAVSWCDGEMSAVAAIAANVDLYSEHLIKAFKQNPARSAAEQGADLCKVFNNLKANIRNYSGDDSPGTRRMHDKIAIAIKKLEADGDLQLNGKNKKALLGFLSILPKAATKAASVENIEHGFIANGMIDRETKRFPVLANILNTCKRDILVKEAEAAIDAFPELLTSLIKYGYVPEELFDKYEFAVDTSKDGKEFIRNNSIRSEHMNRAKWLTHPHEIERRLKHIEEKKLASKAKREKENMEHQKHLDNHAAIVKKLCDMIGKAADVSNLKDCKLRHFDNLSSPELKSFIRYHDNNLKKIGDIPKNKGTLEEAMRGMNKRILAAFNCRTSPCKLEQQLPHSMIDDHDEEEVTPLEDLVLVHTVGNEDDGDAISPSDLLDNEQWVKRTVELFDLDEYVPECFKAPHGDDEEERKNERSKLKKNADVLMKILRHRLKQHIDKRAATRKDHWAWKFARKNLAVVAAYMILADHTKSRVACVKEGNSLLSPKENKFKPCKTSPKHEGCYLFFDSNNGVFIRSGKVTGRGVDERLSEHKSGAEATTAESDFYDLYPSEESARKEKRGKKGFFEDLLPVFGAGFDPNSSIAECVNKDVKEGGVLLLSEFEKAKIASSKVSNDGRMSDAQKFRSILAYQFELGYDLAIALCDNVSQSPGFESFIGIFGGITEQ
jgi:hypothetical protein